VMWTEDRRENLLACAHAHEQKVKVTVAVRRDGTIPAIRSHVWVDQGAHALGPIGAGLEPMTTGQSIIGPYRMAHYDCETYGLLTNKCPQGPYRGVGTVQGIFIIERLMDMVADRLGLDPVKTRLITVVGSQKMLVYDDIAENKVILFDKGVQVSAGDFIPAADISGGKLTNASASYAASSSESQQISANAFPKLRQEALAAQSANIASVSGATYTSSAYKSSLQAALNAAHA